MSEVDKVTIAERKLAGTCLVCGEDKVHATSAYREADMKDGWCFEVECPRDEFNFDTAKRYPTNE